MKVTTYMPGDARICSRFQPVFSIMAIHGFPKSGPYQRNPSAMKATAPMIQAIQLI
jgi:hypothetical protein